MNDYSNYYKIINIRKDKIKKEHNNFNPEYLSKDQYEFIPESEKDSKKKEVGISLRNEINFKKKSNPFETNDYFKVISTKIRKYHPNIKIDYFEKINTKNKAYWLGFLYADGYISKIRNNKIFGIKVGIKDENILDRFINEIGINPTFKRVIENQKKIRIQITCDKIVSDLERCGVISNKSNILELPKLWNRELYLSFLLGYYDGDGTTGTTRITSGSEKFLEQIRNHFNIKNKIRGESTKGTIDGRYFKGFKYVLYLGAELFNEMLDNYKESMSKKSHRFITNEERIKKKKKNAWISNERKFKGTKKELETLIWKMPMTKIGKNYGVSSSIIKKWCKKWGINTPFRGYWAKKNIKDIES